MRPLRFAMLAMCLSAAAIACSDPVAPARPQVLLVVDTNVVVVGQVALRDDVSRVAAIDTVRIDVLDDAGAIVETRTIIAPDPSNWPLSIGILPRASGGVRFRIRAFRGIYGHPATLAEGAPLEPPREVTIDRLVVVSSFPSEGVRTLRVKLEGDCLGIPAIVDAPSTTCVDASATAAEPTAGIQLDPGAPARTTTEAGAWDGAKFVDCTVGSPNDDAICIPGGFTILGDLTLTGIEGALPELHDSAPLRPVRLSPFYIDRHEFTVGRLRKLGVDALGVEPEPFVPGRPANANCTFRGFADDVNDALPLNCVGWAAARQLCKSSGGDLVTEAQWEYVARGRGEQRTYPWGSAIPGCCGLSIERATSGPLNGCGRGPEPVGSHADPARCKGIADLSRDGVRDLGGSMSEFLRDVFAPYDAKCWGGAGIATDPVCIDDKSQDHVIRGATWNDGITFAQGTIRQSNGDDFEVTTSRGFRCAYPGAAP